MCPLTAEHAANACTAADEISRLQPIESGSLAPPLGDWLETSRAPQPPAGQATRHQLFTLFQDVGGWTTSVVTATTSDFKINAKSAGHPHPSSRLPRPHTRFGIRPPGLRSPFAIVSRAAPFPIFLIPFVCPGCPVHLRASRHPTPTNNPPHPPNRIVNVCCRMLRNPSTPRILTHSYRPWRKVWDTTPPSLHYTPSRLQVARFVVESTGRC